MGFGAPAPYAGDRRRGRRGTGGAADPARREVTLVTVGHAVAISSGPVPLDLRSCTRSARRSSRQASSSSCSPSSTQWVRFPQRLRLLCAPCWIGFVRPRCCLCSCAASWARAHPGASPRPGLASWTWPSWTCLTVSSVSVTLSSSARISSVHRFHFSGILSLSLFRTDGKSVPVGIYDIYALGFQIFTLVDSTQCHLPHLVHRRPRGGQPAF